MRRRNKRTGTQRSAPGSLRQAPRADSVKDLLSRISPNLTRLTQQAARQTSWRRWFATHLPPEIADKISGVVEKDGSLVLFAESAVWSARLRYAALELEPKIRAADARITTITVKVLPKSAGAD